MVPLSPKDQHPPHLTSLPEALPELNYTNAKGPTIVAMKDSPDTLMCGLC